MPKEFGVFAWTPENRYPRAKAVKIYKSKKRAYSAANKMGAPYVDRPIW